MARLPRWLLLALLAWWSVRLLAHPLDEERIYGSFLHLINLPFHEAGHVLCAPFGPFMTALGGSLMQLLVPAVCAGSFVRRGDTFAAAVCVWWTGQNLLDLAPYVADARALKLVLLGGATGAEVEGHDWEAILGTLGWLHLDQSIARLLVAAGALLMLGSLAAAGWNTARACRAPDPAL